MRSVFDLGVIKMLVQSGGRVLGPLISIMILGCLLFSLFAAGSVPAEELKTTAHCSWDKPSYGTPVVYYVVNLEKCLGDETLAVEVFPEIFADSLEVELEFGFKYRVRVAGVDASDRQGPWSRWSPYYSPEADAGDLFFGPSLN